MSFRRRQPKAPTAQLGVTDCAVPSAGTRVVSTGIRGFDALLGGGVALGRVVAIIEDGVSALHAHVLAAFAGNALQLGHALAVALPSAPAEELIASIEAQRQPPALAHSQGREVRAAAPQLSIAWRYAPRPSTTPTAINTTQQQLNAQQYEHGTRRVSALGFPNLNVRDLIDNLRAHCKRAAKDGVPARGVIASLGAIWEWDDLDLHFALTELRIMAKENNAPLIVTLPKSTQVAHAALGADAVVRMTPLPPGGGRSPAGVALLEKAPHITPGVWLGCRGDAYHYRATRRGVAFELATIEPEDGDPKDDLACSKGNAL